MIGGENEPVVLVFYECCSYSRSRCSMCGFDKVMKTRLLKRPVRFYCHDESDLNISGTCNSESFTSKVEMILISGFLCDFYVTCNKCGNVTNHRWFAIPGQCSHNACMIAARFNGGYHAIKRRHCVKERMI